MTATARFELFSYWRTSATYRVRVALHLKGIAADEHDINIDQGAQRSEAFLEINPLGAIPALLDREAGPGAAPLTQSLAILEFLDESYPAPPLLPADAHGRARVRALCGMLAADTHPLIVPRVKKYLAAHARFDDDAWRAWQTHWFSTGLQAVERRLSSEAQTGTYCHGDAVTLADLCLASILAVTRVFKIEIPQVPTVDRIVAACDTLDAFRRADPYAQAGAPPR